MKKIVRVLWIFMLCIGICMATQLSASATNSAEDDYYALFAEAEGIDPLSAEAYAERLNAAYLTDPQQFLCILSQQDDEVILSVIGLWTANNTLEEIYCLYEQISNYSNSISAPICSVLQEQISCREYGIVLQSYGSVSQTDEVLYDAAILNRFIDLNMQHSTMDEELNQKLALVYNAAPNLLITLLRDYSNEEVELIAYYIADGYEQLGMEVGKNIDTTYMDTRDEEIAYQIQTQIVSGSNFELQMEEVAVVPPDVEIMSTCVPTIGTMTYSSSAPLVVGSEETLTITFSESSQVPYLRQWWVEVYQVVGSHSYLKCSKTISMPPGANSGTFALPLSFTDTCSFQTHVKVYTQQGGDLLCERTGQYPDIVYGYWKINVVLPEDRDNTGWLYLYDASGTLCQTMRCLGQSVSNDPPDVYYGNTPMGVYTGYLHGPVSPTSSYGPYKVVATNNVSGLVVEANRDGIWIHGGHETQLNPTNGCVRITNPNQLTLQNSISNLINNEYHYSTGNVYIDQEDDGA